MQILPFESDSWVLEGNGGILSEERILHFLKQCTGVEVVFLLVFSRRSLSIRIAFLAFISFFWFQFSSSHWGIITCSTTILFLISWEERSARSRFAISCLFCFSRLIRRFIMIVSGIMYDFLRGPPLLMATPNGGISLFSRRGATICEGLLFGLLGKY